MEKSGESRITSAREGFRSARFSPQETIMLGLGTPTNEPSRVERERDPHDSFRVVGGSRTDAVGIFLANTP